MGATRQITSLSHLLCFLQIASLCLAASLSVNGQTDAEKRTGNNPNALSFIGTYENVSYYQESLSLNQGDAKQNCFIFDLQLTRLRNQDHLDFIIFSGGRDRSWTDGITFYERGIYQPAVDATIPIAHYTNLGLRIEATNRSLVPEDANYLHPSICSVQVLDVKKGVSGVENDGAPAEVNSNVNKRGAVSPKVYLGSFNGYQYHQDPIPRTQSDARRECEVEGRHLATFVNRLHLDFISAAGALDRSWTAHSANVTREVFRWGNNSPIAEDIRISPFPTPLGLVIRTEFGNHVLQGDLEDTLHPSICMLHVGP